ncbi:MAG: hypothetical protein JRG89_11575, partial [Deltaproteobacteria bacterium]|nr:hypothetical protein [Deltaproteobacteria bacterium]
MYQLNSLTNDQLLTRLHHLIQRDHAVEAELITHLGEVDARRLYNGLACPSMFDYCVRVLHFAEGVAYKRIAVARAARQFPELLVALASGDIHLTAASLIAPHLSRGDAVEWVALARHATAREIKQRIADLNPKADVRTSVRRAPRFTAKPDDTTTARERASAAGATQTAAPAARTQQPRVSESPTQASSSERTKAGCEPLGAERYCVRFVADQQVHEQLQELRALLRHSIPDGDVAKILARAVGALLGQVRKQKIGSCSSPRGPRPPSSGMQGAVVAKRPSRHIPAEVRRAVWTRDGGRCTYVSPEGRQCGSAEFLEYHHQVPWARSRKHQ